MRDFLHQRVINLSQLGVVILTVVTMASFLASFSHLADILTSFRHLYVIGAIVVLLGLAAFDRRKLAALAAAVAWINFVLIASSLPRWSSCEPNFTIVTLNALGADTDVPATMKMLTEAEADVVVVTELGSSLSTALQKQWRYFIAKPREHTAGMGIFSRTPISNTGSQDGAWFPQLEAVVAAHDKSVALLGVHPPPPITEESAQLRNEEIADLAVQMLQIDGPAILAGDLNLTRQSPKFQPLLDVGLVDTRLGHGIAGTWPSALPFRVGIDHILHTPDIQTCSIEVSDSTGSDHRPLIARLKL